MTTTNVRELLRQRADLVSQAQALHNTAEGENRDLSEQEAARYNDLISQVDGLTGRIERGQRLENLEQVAQRAGRRQIVEDGDTGMTTDEINRYSVLRAINAAATQNWRGAELELEASQRAAAMLGKQPQGFFVPHDVLRRDLTKGTAADGGYTVATELLSQSFVDLLRNRMTVRAAGATVLGGLQGDIAIPKQTGGATAYWVAESGASTESQQTFGQVSLTPKTVGAYTDISRKLLKQSSLDVEAFVRGDLTTTLALAIDLAALHGSGASNQPTGLAATGGIGSVAGGTNGAAPSWANLIALETAVATANADTGRLAYMTNAKVRGKLKGTIRGTSADAMIWETNAGNTPVNGYPVHVTNQVSAALTKGSAAGVCSAIFFGNWSDLLIGMWGGLDILVDPYTGGTSGTVRVIALQDVDIAVRQPASFAAMLDALTT